MAMRLSKHLFFLISEAVGDAAGEAVIAPNVPVVPNVAAVDAGRAVVEAGDAGISPKEHKYIGQDWNPLDDNHLKEVSHRFD